MPTTRLRHALAMVTGAALLASLTAASVATPASAAKPRCAGKAATIVGTKKGDVIRGTARRDVIVARGGHDRIYGRGGNDIICAGLGHDLVAGGPGIDRLYGQSGNDKLHGGPGPDFLAGQAGNDLLNGGIGLDTCHQGTGMGPWLNCERPIPEPPTLVIAYSDVNTNHVYDAGDVMIAKIVDSATDGIIGPGDTIKMGQYPTSPFSVVPAAVLQPFEDWQVKSHLVTTGDTNPDPDIVVVSDGTYNHGWVRVNFPDEDIYFEQGPGGMSGIQDDPTPGDVDTVEVKGSVSQPVSVRNLSAEGKGDDGFIDVDIYAP